jgi:anti-sigma factor RsiW
MTCRKAAYWMQLYIDGRLAHARFARLEHHLSSCASCLREFALLRMVSVGASTEQVVDEPEGLGEAIMWRVAAYEAQRRAPENAGWLAGVPQWALSWRGAVTAAILLLVLIILQPGPLSGLNPDVRRTAEDGVRLLLTPGPESIVWGIWLAGIGAALFLSLWFARAEASSGWRRAIAQRWPQLW